MYEEMTNDLWSSLWYFLEVQWSYVKSCLRGKWSYLKKKTIILIIIDYFIWDLIHDLVWRTVVHINDLILEEQYILSMILLGRTDDHSSLGGGLMIVFMILFRRSDRADRPGQADRETQENFLRYELIKRIFGFRYWSYIQEELCCLFQSNCWPNIFWTTKSSPVLAR